MTHQVSWVSTNTATAAKRYFMALLPLTLTILLSSRPAACHGDTHGPGSADPVVRHDRGMIGPALVMRRCAVGDDVHCPAGQFGRGDVIVDAPARVVVESTTTPRPPGVGTVAVAAVAPLDVHVSQLVEQAVHPGPFLGQEAGTVAV